MSKPKSKSLSRSPMLLHTYDDLRKYARAFADGHLNLLVVLGNPGLGKSQILKASIGDHACAIEGRTSAFGMYLRLFEHRNQPVLIDDVDELHRDRDAIRLLKSLCQTDHVKKLSWNSAASLGTKKSVPDTFTTTSNVAIVANDWQRLNLDIAALEDRGHVVEFVPEAIEVHHQAATWFWDQEVFDFIGTNLSLLEQPSFRHYVTAAELKQARLDWRGGVLARCLSGTRLAVAQLKANSQFSSEEERARAFVAAGHGCRATYFNIAKTLPPPCEAPKLILTSSEPQSGILDFDIQEILRRRFGQIGEG